MNTANGVQELELRIKTGKSSFAIGETIRLEIALRNTGSTVIKTPKYFMLPADDRNKNNLEIQVHDLAGKRLSRVSQVLTGRSLDSPEIVSINPGETYRDSVQLAGTFARKQGRKKVEQALWSLGENPEETFASEYPSMSQGTFEVKVSYRVDESHLINLDEGERSAVWKGQLISNTIELSIR